MYRLLLTVTVMLTLVGPAWSQTLTAAQADFNGDGEVEFNDFLLFTEKFNTRHGDDEYEAKYDLDGNGEVNFADFISFVGVFGQRVPSSPPVAHAGEYQSVDTGDLVTLNGANSRDPEGQPLTFAWRQIEGPSITLSDANIARPTFRTREAGHYTFELVVHDGDASSRPDTVAVDVVTISEAAVFVGGADAAFTYKETTGDQMVFTAQTGAPQVQVGEVLVNTVEPYFLKKVTHVVSQSTGEVVVETEDATLTDVVEEAHIRQTFRFPATKLALASGSSSAGVCTDKNEVCASVSNISLDPTIDFDLNISDGDIQYLKLEAGIHLNAEMNTNMNARGELKVKKEIDVTEKLGRLSQTLENVVQFGSQVTQTLVIKPSIVLGVEGSIGAKGNVKVEVDINRSSTIGVKYEDGEFNPYNYVNEQGEGITHEIGDLTDYAKLRAHMSGKLHIYLGKDFEVAETGGAGVIFSLGPSLNFNTTDRIGDSEAIGWAIRMGIYGKATVHGPFAKFFGITISTLEKSWDFTLLDIILAQTPTFEANFMGITHVYDENIKRYVFYVLHRDVKGGGKVYEATKNNFWEYRELFDLEAVENLTSLPQNKRIQQPLGITSHPNTKDLYVVGADGSAENPSPVMYQYSKTGEDWKQARVYGLDQENSDPTGGIVYAEGLFYVVDNEDKKVYVYDFSPGGSGKSFSLDKDNQDPWGITYADNRLYIVDNEDKKVYAYTITGVRDKSSEFYLDDANDDPTGITYPNFVYVTNYKSSDIYEYGPPDVKVDSLVVSKGKLDAGESFTLSVKVENRGDTQANAIKLHYYRSIYSLDYRQKWQVPDPELVKTIEIDRLNEGDRIVSSIELTAPAEAWNNEMYYYSACAEKVSRESEWDTYKNCSDDVSVQILSEDAPITFEMEQNIKWAPFGITYADDYGFFYVVGGYVDSGGAEQKVYKSRWKKIKEDSLVWVEEDDFDLGDDFYMVYQEQTGYEYHNLIRDVTYDDDQLYVLQKDKIWVCDIDDNSRNYGKPRLYRQLDSSIFPDPTGITYANGQFYVVNYDSIETKRVGSVRYYEYEESRWNLNFPLDEGTEDVVSIAYHKGLFYLLSRSSNKVYVYNNSGKRVSDLEFHLASYNRNSSGITYADGRFYVTNDSPPKIYAYPDKANTDLSDDRFVLIALYNATDGENWENNTNWVSDNLLNEWYGVSTNAQGRVDSLHLSENQLTGSLPDSLGLLTDLTYLDLRRNQLTGPIPEALGNLSNLTHLYLSQNQLSSPIPPELGNLSKLEGLGLSANQLSGTIPEALGNLSNLTRLELFGNQLSGCVPEGMRNVDTDNSFALGLPFCGEGDAATDRAALVAVYEAMEGDKWENINNWLTDKPLKDWTGVRADANGRVTSLHLNDIPFSGSIPPELGNLTELVSLRIGKQLSGSIPPELGNLTNLVWLELHHNQLSGSIPPELGKLTNLEWLDLGANQLSGSIPSELGKLTNLTWLDLGANQLSGPIPPELGNLTKLTRLDLHDNQLSGTLPHELGNLTSLEYLWLVYNQLSGSIPSELGNLYSLKLLDLSANQLSGPIPPELGYLTRLEYLWLGLNNLTDISPLGGLRSLKSMDIRGNAISPSSIDASFSALRRDAVTLYDHPISESDYDIDLVFLSERDRDKTPFNEFQKQQIQYATDRWMSIIREDIPDYTFSQLSRLDCGDLTAVPRIGERIDDLRIYMNIQLLNVVEFYVAGVKEELKPAALGGPLMIRFNDVGAVLPVVGCIQFDRGWVDKPSTAYIDHFPLDPIPLDPMPLIALTLHEMAHVLGIGTQWSNFVQRPSNDLHFNGPLAIAAFDAAGGRNYTGAKVPVEPDGAHWRAPILSGEIMGGGRDRRVSAITIQALADMGYVVDVSQADPYTLPMTSATKIVAFPYDWMCGGSLQGPVYMVDQQGRVIRTLSH